MGKLSLSDIFKELLTEARTIYNITNTQFYNKATPKKGIWDNEGTIINLNNKSEFNLMVVKKNDELYDAIMNDDTKTASFPQGSVEDNVYSYFLHLVSLCDEKVQGIDKVEKGLHKIDKLFNDIGVKSKNINKDIKHKEGYREVDFIDLKNYAESTFTLDYTYVKPKEPKGVPKTGLTQTTSGTTTASGSTISINRLSYKHEFKPVAIEGVKNTFVSMQQGFALYVSFPKTVLTKGRRVYMDVFRAGYNGLELKNGKTLGERKTIQINNILTKQGTDISTCSYVDEFKSLVRQIRGGQ